MNTLYETMADGRRSLSVNDANATGGGLRAASIVSGSRATGTLARGVPALALVAALGVSVTAGEAWGANCQYDTNGVKCGTGASANADTAIAIGTSATADGSNTTAIGTGAQATAENATAIGTSAQATAKNATAIGKDAIADAANAIATGDTAKASAQSSIAIGNIAQSEAQNAIAMGTNSKSSAAGAIAIGGHGGGTGAAVTASAEAGVALGGSGAGLNAAQVDKAGGAALGAGSRTTGAAGVAGYDILSNSKSLLSTSAWKSTAPDFAVGEGENETRNIINMAAGSEDTDGVNVAQLKQLQEAIADHHFYISANGKSAGVYGEDTITFVGDDNIFVDLNGQTISVQLNPNLTADSVTINDGGPVMNEGGINMSNRPITNVADGRNPHDAVNRGQLDGMDGRLRAGIAGAVAQANIPQVMTPGAYMLGAGLGHSKNRLALGVGWSARSDNGRWVLRNSVGLHDDATSFGAGVGYEF